MKREKILSLVLTILVTLSVVLLSTGQAVKDVKVAKTNVTTKTINVASNLSKLNTISSNTTAPSIDNNAIATKVSQKNTTTTSSTSSAGVQSVGATTNNVTGDTTVPFLDANGNIIANTTVSNTTVAVTNKSSLVQAASDPLISVLSVPMEGIDVYSGTDVTDWTAVKNAGVQAVYIKLTDGLTYNNPAALAQYNGAKSAGLKVGAYHFAEHNDVDSEYNHFATEAAKYKWDLKPVLDYESGGTIDYNYISRFMAKDANLIYYGSHNTADNTGLPISRIWIAEPADSGPGEYAFTGTTKGYAGIQYLWHGSISGLQGDADVDIFSDDVLLKPLPELLCVDTPINGTNTLGSVNILGWTLNDSGNKQVDILVDGKENGIATLGLLRTDVASAYPNYGASNSGFSYTLDTSKLDYGNHNITVESTANDGSSTTQNINIVTVPTESQSSGVGVTYRTQVQNLGWQPYVSDGSEAGTDGQSLRVEAFNMNLVNAPAGASIQYDAYVQNIGWQNFVQDGAQAGTVGQGLRVEAFKIKLLNMPTYSVQYQAYVQGIGWQDSVQDGAEAGTESQGLRVEAMRIQIVPRINVTSISLNKSSDTLANAGDTDTLTTSITPSNATDKNINWTSSNNGVVTVDNTGKITGVNAGNATITAVSEDGSQTATCSVTVMSSNINVSSISLNKTTDVLNPGTSDTLSATINPSNATNKNVNWTSSNTAVVAVDNTGKTTGIAAGSATITALTQDGSKVATCVVTVVNPLPIGVSYTTQVQHLGWMPSVLDGAEAGTEGQSLRVEAIKINLVNAQKGASIQYQAHVQSIGWQPLVSNGAQAGTVGKSLRIEALKITLVGMPGYSVQYRTYVQNIGWQAWVADGAQAGTTGESLRVEAVEIRVVPTK
jgi:uncharacterized protein YjdB/GH25 family lysozyme M1 (1,4-beta-N-acetylmuramidase)